MRSAIRVCIKDLQHSWLQAAVVIMLVALRSLLDVLLPGRPWLLVLHTATFQVLMPLVCFILTALVVQEDALVGGRQFWITRPIPWYSLLAGKLLFLLCVISLPVLIFQSAAMTLNGLSPFRHLSVLSMEQLALLATLAVAVLLASVTRNLVQFALAVLATYALVTALSLMVGLRFLQSVIHDWSNAGDVHGMVLGAVFIPVPATLIWLQYSRRATRSVITLSMAVLLLTELLPAVNFWYPAARWRAITTGTLRGQSPVTVSFLPVQSLGDRTRRVTFGEEGGAGIRLPVHVTGIPPGRTLVNERMNFAAAAPDGSAWESGWVEIGGINMMAPPPHRQEVIPADGDYWLAVYVSRMFYERVQDRTSRARVSLAFRLVGQPVQTTLPLDRMSPVCGGDGRCGQVMLNGQYQVVCLFAEQPPAVLLLGYLRARLNETGSSTIWRYEVVGPAVGPSPVSSAAVLTVYPEEQWFVTTLDIPEIRLGDYTVRMLTP